DVGGGDLHVSVEAHNYPNQPAPAGSLAFAQSGQDTAAIGYVFPDVEQIPPYVASRVFYVTPADGSLLAVRYVDDQPESGGVWGGEPLDGMARFASGNGIFDLNGSRVASFDDALPPHPFGYTRIARGNYSNAFYVSVSQTDPNVDPNYWTSTIFKISSAG